jgi:hypothetical protein
MITGFSLALNENGICIKYTAHVSNHSSHSNVNNQSPLCVNSRTPLDRAATSTVYLKESPIEMLQQKH